MPYSASECARDIARGTDSLDYLPNLVRRYFFKLKVKELLPPLDVRDSPLVRRPDVFTDEEFNAVYRASGYSKKNDPSGDITRNQFVNDVLHGVANLKGVSVEELPRVYKDLAFETAPPTFCPDVSYAPAFEHIKRDARHGFTGFMELNGYGWGPNQKDDKGRPLKNIQEPQHLDQLLALVKKFENPTPDQENQGREERKQYYVDVWSEAKTISIRNSHPLSAARIFIEYLDQDPFKEPRFKYVKEFTSGVMKLAHEHGFGSHSKNIIGRKGMEEELTSAEQNNLRSALGLTLHPESPQVSRRPIGLN